MTRHLIIGNGVAGTTAAENIRKRNREDSITILSSEHLPFYYRIRLNDFIAGTIDEQSIIARKDIWYKERNIKLKLATRVIGADPKAGEVHTEHTIEPYDRLLLANGSHPFVPPVPGADNPRVHTLHTIADAKAIMEAGRHAKNVIIIGGGLLGLETAASLCKFDCSITVVEFLPRLLPRQLDSPGGARLEEILRNQLGLTFKIGTGTTEIRNNEVVLAGGETLPADLVIISAGVRPDLSLARSLNLTCDRGIQVDEHLRTSTKNIFAAGDVVQFQETVYGIWPAAMEQGKIAGANMADDPAIYTGTTMANTLKVAGVSLASAGEIEEKERCEVLVENNDRIYRKLIFENNCLIGCIFLGDTTGYPAAVKAITNKEEIPSAEIFQKDLFT